MGERKVAVVCLWVMVASGLRAQPHNEELCAWAGGSLQGNNFSASWSVGEHLTETIGDVPAGLLLTQGFHQSFGYITASDFPDPGLSTFQVYPNPTYGPIVIEVTAIPGHTIYSLLAENGQLMRVGKLESPRTELCISSLASGVYHLIIRGPHGHYFSRISKLN